MNPCPCGYYGDVFRQCTCTPGTVQKYQKCISGPVLARIDLHIQVPRLREEELLQPRTGEASAAIRVRVCRAREVQARRFASAPPAQPSSSVRLPYVSIIDETKARWALL
jgi:magnesium chelatase family protein